jgi:flagellar biosynthesis regulator FlbT
MIGQYLHGVYYAVLMIGGNEIGPVNTGEIIFCTVSIMMGCFINAIIFSEIVVQIQNYQEAR